MFEAGMLGVLALVGMTAPAAAQPRDRLERELVLRQAVGAQPQRVEATPFVDEQSARDIRMRLNEILRGYPPSLAQVLRLDPSLMSREDYLAPYPALAAFIAQHPEITRDPSFYLGQSNGDNRGQEDANSRAVRIFGEVMGAAFVLCGFIAFFTLVGWLARLVIGHRRWLRATKTQTDVHSKLLDRLTSNEDLLAYIQTPAGQQFLQSAPIPLETGPRVIDAPIGRILWSVQAGTVLAVVGIGLWYVKRTVIAELAGPLNVVGVLAVALGVGFVLSAGVSYLLSRRLGLLEPPRS